MTFVRAAVQTDKPATDNNIILTICNQQLAKTDPATRDTF